MIRSSWFRLVGRSTRSGQQRASWKKTTPRKKKLRISWRGNRIDWIEPKTTGTGIKLNKQGSKSWRKMKKRPLSLELTITPLSCRYKKPCASNWPLRANHQPSVKFTLLASLSRKQAKQMIPVTHLQRCRDCMIGMNRRRSSKSCLMSSYSRRSTASSQLYTRIDRRATNIKQQLSQHHHRNCLRSSWRKLLPSRRPKRHQRWQVHSFLPPLVTTKELKIIAHSSPQQTSHLMSSSSDFKRLRVNWGEGEQREIQPRWSFRPHQTWWQRWTASTHRSSFLRCHLSIK